MKFSFYISTLALLFLFSCKGKQKVVSSTEELPNEKEVTEQAMLDFKYLYLEGLKNDALGNRQQAIAYFDRCIKTDENNDAPYYCTAKILAGQNDFTGALEMAKKASVLAPDNHWYKLFIADIYLRNNEIGNAISIYEELVLQFPEKIDWMYELGSLYSQSEDLQNALKIYEEIEGKIGISDKVCITKSQIYADLGKEEKVYSELQKLIKAFPEEYRFKGILAEYYTSYEEYDKALDIYQELVKINENNSLIRISFSNFYFTINEPQKAFEQLKIVFKDPYTEPSMKLRILLKDFQAGDPSSKSYFEQLINILLEVHPDDYGVNTVYADYLVKEQKYGEAQQRLLKVLEYNKSALRAWEQLLQVDIRLNQFDSLYVHCSSVLEYFPSQPLFYLYKGLACQNLENYAESVEVLKLGLDLIVENKNLEAEFYSNMAESYNNLKEFELSDQYFEKHLTISPNNTVVLNNYSYYLSLRNEKMDRALELIEKCIALTPQSATYLDTYAWVLYVRGDYKEAKKIIEKALKYGGNTQSVIVEHYGDILYKLGLKSDALLQWKLAITLGNGTEFLEQKIQSKKLIE